MDRLVKAFFNSVRAFTVLSRTEKAFQQELGLLPEGTELPPTGKRVEMKGMELVRVRDGKIVVDNLYYDNLAVAAQLGLVPQGASTPV